MGRENLRFGGGVAATVLHPAVLIAVLIAGVLICVLPRRKAIVPFLVAAILIPTDQVLVIGPAHFSMLRVLILAGLIRLWILKASSKVPLFSGGMNRLDLSVMLLAASSAISGSLLWQTSGIVIYQLGELYTICGMYFLLRFLIRNQEDVERVLRVLAYIAIVVALLMVYEQAKGWNPYALLGGARAWAYEQVMERDGRFRAMGCFAQPIPAGTFGAVIAPLFFALWCSGKKHRGVAVAGVIAATVITLASNSSTPLTAYMAGALGLMLWSLRGWMRAIRWSLVLTLVSLHMVMKAPVWHLVSRVDLSGGSSSYHRYQLIDQFIRHFGDWWMVGTKSNADWGWDMWDMANQYVAIGETSGILPFILFLAIIAYAFKYLGTARRAPAQTKKSRLFIWSLGSALFAHVVAFFGISYFDQMVVVWYGLLAAILAVVATQPAKAADPPQFVSGFDCSPFAASSRLGSGVCSSAMASQP